MPMTVNDSLCCRDTALTTLVAGSPIPLRIMNGLRDQATLRRHYRFLSAVLAQILEP